MRPALTLKHLEQCGLIGAERIAFDLLQSHGLKAPTRCFGDLGFSEKHIFLGVNHVGIITCRRVAYK